MRFSSLVSLLVVTASFALGGCAADADQTSSEVTGQGESALVGSGRASRTVDSRGIPQAAALADEAARTRVMNKVTGEAIAVGRTGLNVDRGVSPSFTETVGMDEGLAAGIDTAARADLIVDQAANPVDRAQVGPAFGAHLPGSQQLSGSGSGETQEETSTSGAKREP